jgi:D-alanine-D-alanine ligase
MSFYDVAVIFGGISNENEISVLTGTMVCNLLKKGGKKVLPIYLDQKGNMYAGESLADIKSFESLPYINAPTCVIASGGALIFGKRGKIKERATISCGLNCCHGGDGEGGGVSGLFAINNIPLASAGRFESSAFMDKYYTKLVLKSLGIELADYVYLRDIKGAIEKIAPLSYPVIIKPCRLGSSIGIQKAENDKELLLALEQAFMYDDGVIVEKFISPRREINCAAYFAEGRVITSECEEALTCGDLLSYDDKYSGGGKRVYPAHIPDSIAKNIKDTTAFIYTSLNMRGIVRFDFMLSGEQVILSEINTVPGSLSYYLLSSGFAEFYSVLEGVIRQAKADFDESRKKLILNTGIINNFVSNACKIK